VEKGECEKRGRGGEERRRLKQMQRRRQEKVTEVEEEVNVEVDDIGYYQLKKIKMVHIHMNNLL
jgi:hypothetical protein